MPSTRSLVTGLIGLAVLLVFVLGASKLQSVNGQLSRSRADLASTRQDLATTQDDLSSTEDDLGDMTDERDQLQAEKRDLQSQIDGLQGSLTDARNQVNLQASQITTLKTCLSGVSIALGDVVNMDYAGAVSALDAVRAPCNEAAKLL